MVYIEGGITETKQSLLEPFTKQRSHLPYQAEVGKDSRELEQDRCFHMSFDDSPPAKELQRLASIYHKYGYLNQAREILDQLNKAKGRRTTNTPDESDQRNPETGNQSAPATA